MFYVALAAAYCSTYTFGYLESIPAALSSPAQDIVHKNGLDDYLFLRFLKLLIAIFGNRTGLDQYQWANIPAGALPSAHYWGVSTNLQVWFYFECFAWLDRHEGFVLYMIRREIFHFVHMRHQFLISKSHLRLAQARTVFITNLLDDLAKYRDLRQFCSLVPGRIQRIWICRNSRNLYKKSEARQKVCKKLESASSKLLRNATKEWARRQKAQRKPAGKLIRKSKDMEKAERYAADEGFYPDSLIAPPPSQLGECESLESAFVQCNLQIGAHVLAQCVSYHEPLFMGDKYIEVSPNDMIWANLDCFPFILRALAWFECIPRSSFLEISVYKQYYAFLVVHGFLIVTLNSAIASTITDIITQPTNAVENLAGRLPDASMFFLTYMITQGLTGAAGTLIQLGALTYTNSESGFWDGRLDKRMV
ncbi:DUF221-domain-containing protein [Neolentinus lepideus HHB14362 ss-1]|uniref:DUF221-domain-containing protein n=1 Tax=Neolentinus lepideus HHB14362 ss-1 TaxID=1314782 RepID=A0A165RP75_9AGAM|nr:DUF221-domain-containing protein [Neolentinus lepideus HHB14362 ss-1]